MIISWCRIVDIFLTFDSEKIDCFKLMYIAEYLILSSDLLNH